MVVKGHLVPAQIGPEYYGFMFLIIYIEVGTSPKLFPFIFHTVVGIVIVSLFVFSY